MKTEMIVLLCHPFLRPGMKTILQGTVQGGQRRGRQKKEMGGQYPRMGSHGTAGHSEKSREQGGVGKLVDICQKATQWTSLWEQKKESITSMN
ncbi:hypothetical protein PoB_005119600 [Plakobranchus ocellatus]|uniref:Uncharacterized protein n=1 Tax=Plakobranchus ocellatus TaxID=259542 RepID=A0AAV4BZZ6_9GAST|nr:hypothetical protein PoB_005119600 [Plakobranchus ocellatus]